MPLFSIKAADCRFDYYRGSGAGGQHRNKTSSAVRCTHEPSGAVGQSEKTRSQHENKRLAFGRMARTSAFQGWLRLKIARITGKEVAVNDAVDRAMRSPNLRVEGKDGRGRWGTDDIEFE